MTLRRKSAVLAFSLFFLIYLSACVESISDEKESKLLVFASASLRDVMRDVGAAYTRQSGTQIVFNFAGSNVLARQIEASSRADVYLSANEHWVSYLSDRNLLDDSSRRIFLSNNLVVVASADSSWSLEDPSELASIPFKFLSLGNPDAVPAGRYAKHYLNSVSVKPKEPDTENGGATVWSQVADKLLPAPDVRAAAAAVAHMPNLIGIIYKTDAVASDKLKILYEIELSETGQQERVKYVAARVSKVGVHTSALSFLDFLTGIEAQKIFEQHGFDTILDDLVIK